MSATKTEAKRRIALALKKIEFAQRFLADAASDISRVAGVVDNWDELQILYDKTKGTWHRLNLRAPANECDMDSEYRFEFARKTRQA